MFLIDYLSFSINLSNITFERVLEKLNLLSFKADFVDMGKVRRYEHCYRLGNINISIPFAENEDMGIFVDFSGQGCREYEQYNQKQIGDTFCWSSFFKRIIEWVNLGYKINITRIDLAFDDFDKKLSLPKIERKLKACEYVSRFKKWSEIKSNSTYSKRGLIGKTIYLGSMQSDCFCRFYDKLAEQHSKYKNDDDYIKNLQQLKHWVRFEIVFKNITAINVVNMIALSYDVNKDISSYINSCVRFVDMTATRTENCKISAFWSNFLETTDIKKIKKVLSTLEGEDPSALWFKKSVAPTAYALMTTYDCVDDFIADIVQHGCMRQSPKHELIVNRMTVGEKLSNQEVWQQNNPFKYDLRGKYKPFHY